MPLPVLPLADKTVLITRAKNQAGQLADLLSPLGAKIAYQAAIEVVPLTDYDQLDQAILHRLNQFSRCVFVSRNTVDFFFRRINQLDRLEAVRNQFVSVAAIGAGTAQAVQSLGLTVNLIPPIANSQSLAAVLIGQPASDRTMILRASRGSSELATALTQAQVPFEQFPVYQSRDITSAEPEVKLQLNRGEIDWTTVTSSAIARSLINLLGDSLANTKIASISPTTTRALTERGFPPTVEAANYNMAGIVKAILGYY